ncbi:MAG: hypothetical protein KC620_26490, partial [Myxococcales bacterium]|nr:hypothetical protein [Myxococcales bacterium]
EPVSEQTVQSKGAPLAVELPIDRAGVYIVELEARDRLGRAQVVSVDLYAGGTGAVSWAKAEAGVFELSTDKKKHAPGDTANVVIKSPFQQAEALVIVDAPGGNQYRWVSVRDGKGTFGVEIEGNYAPKLPVHVVLMRGRVDAARPADPSALDLGKPATVASTIWLEVEPKANQVEVTLKAPETAMPGTQIPLTVKLRDPDGKPLSGEVTLWLVDQAVLALAEEARLDPLPDFILPPPRIASLRDTRNLSFGRIPFAEMPGGDGDGEEESPFDNAT